MLTHPDTADDRAEDRTDDRADDPSAPALGRFAPATAAWFARTLGAPTPAQAGAWAAVAAGRHALVVAPTGSGKTLAAFLWALDRLHGTTVPEPEPARRCRVLYVSPLKALAADVERNLRAPLAGIAAAAARRGETIRPVTIGMRTGDTPPAERRRFAVAPPDILITTPESLFLILTSGARAGLTGVDTIIVDEIHAVAGTKRGAHLAVSLERLDELTDAPVQRIGLSATVTPVEEVARFLAGQRPLTEGGRAVDVVQPGSSKRVEVDVVVPVPDLADLRAAPAPGRAPGRAPASPGPGDPPAAGGPRPLRPSVWPHVEERVVDLVAQNRSTLVFTNSRRGAERLTTRMNEVWAERQGEQVSDPGQRHAAEIQAQSGASAGAPAVLARAHHGSMSRAERTLTETELKEGRLPCVVSTSSLELGIDMGAIDLVVQIGAPPSVASGLQRVGRAGHQVGAVSRGVVFPMHRGDLVPCAVIAERMRAGTIEALAPLTNPLDVLAQQIVAMVAVQDRTVDDLAQVLRRSAPFAALGDGVLHAVLDMLSGRYPSEDFGELRARLVWDRAAGTLSARPGALRLAVTSGGTIPDRGLYGVFLAAGAAGAAGADGGGDRRARGGKRVGELDEEMVYESRVGDTFTLGSSTWRVEEITTDRVLVTPAPGLPGRLPFWKGDSPGRPAELGRAVGAWLREAAAVVSPVPATEAASASASASWSGLDAWAGDNITSYLRDQITATGVLPDDRTIVVEHFRDELGDWRVVIHSPHGAKVHAPWALVLAARIRDRYGVDAAVMHSDDGIVLRLPDLDAAAAGREPGPGLTGVPHDRTGAVGGGRMSEIAGDRVVLDLADLLISPQDVQDEVRGELGQSALFGARFREAAARALLLPRRRPDRRQPLWQQRQRSAQLLAVASAYPDFPIVLEAVRECLQEDFDIASLTTLMSELEDGRVRMVEVTTPAPSPFAQSLLFGYTTQFIYDGDAPLAERRAAALTLDPDLLAELLGQDGQTQIADLLDPDAVLSTEAELEGLAAERHASSAEQVWDLLHRTGPLTSAEVTERTRETVRGDVAGWLVQLEADRRIFRVVRPGIAASESQPLAVPPPTSTSTVTGRHGGEDVWAVVEDAGRLRDALGTGVPAWVPAVLAAPVPDALGDLVRRFARCHGPFTARRLAAHLGVGVAVVEPVLRRLVAARTLITGRLRPAELGGTSEDFCDADVLRTLRRRSLAALRADVSPVRQETLGAFLPRWQSVGELRGVDGLYRAVEQLAGTALPASAVESQILPARVVDYVPAMLDELTASGEVLWCGHRELPGNRGGKDALISLHLAASAPLTLPLLDPHRTGAVQSDLHLHLLELLTGSGGFFLGQLATAAGAGGSETLTALWDLVWAGLVTNDGLGPVRSRLGHRAPSRPTARPRPLGRRPHLAALLSPGAAGHGAGPGVSGLTGEAGGGRWSALPPREGDPTLRTHAQALVLLERHGILTRAVAPSEDVSGTYGDIYRVLAALETAGHVRRGYFVEHLGGSQFALAGAVDQLRTADADLDGERSRDDRRTATCLAATDPANPYGAALAWPLPGPSGPDTDADPAADEAADADAPTDDPAAREVTSDAATTHRPGRKVGATIVLVTGELVLYLERGGRSLLTFTHDQNVLDAAARELAAAVSAGRLGTVRLQRIDGRDALRGASGAGRPPSLDALLSAGFRVTPAGVRLGR